MTAKTTPAKRLRHLRDVHTAQGFDGNWNCDPYMLGLYNGLELALAIAEDRDPAYKEAPKVWLSDIPASEVMLSAPEVA